VTSTSHRPPTLLDYLLEHDFLPQDEGAWFDHDTRHGIIRLACPAGDDSELIVLTPAGACQYTVRFGMNTPSAVIIAALQAAESAILIC
jgi:hypothetical protein